MKFEKTKDESCHFTAQFELEKETGLYIGYIPILPGAHTQGATLDEVRLNLKEVAELVIESLSTEELSGK